MSIIGRTAFRASRQLRAAGPTSGTITEAHAADQNRTKKTVLAKGARRDPELYVCNLLPNLVESSIRNEVLWRDSQIGTGERSCIMRSI